MFAAMMVIMVGCRFEADHLHGSGLPEGELASDVAYQVIQTSCGGGAGTT